MLGIHQMDAGLPRFARAGSDAEADLGGSDWHTGLDRPARGTNADRRIAVGGGIAFHQLTLIDRGQFAQRPVRGFGDRPATEFRSSRRLPRKAGPDTGLAQVQAVLQHLRELEVQIRGWHRENEASKKLAQIPAIGPITASALVVASIRDAKSFENGRQLAAWLGLVPKQHSSGGKQLLLGISKHGDTYLRTLLIPGARAVIRVAERKPGYAQSWLAQLIGRRNKNVAAVALANKNARIVWALLAHERDYQPGYEPSAA